MKLKSAEGEILHKRVLIKIAPPAPEKIERIVMVAPAKKAYSAADIHAILEGIADALETGNPTMEFRLVELSPNKFNFVYDGPRRESAGENK